MKVKCEIDMNIETGDFDIRFWNVSRPGKPIEYNEVRGMLQKIFATTDKKIEKEDSPQVTKMVH